jgi:LysR family transcriptional regulator, hca operon transcriptional activator
LSHAFEAWVVELRHLRYFVAVAEEGSLTLAAERRLHTAQPSLSRQMRDLEAEVGVQLLARNARGIELTEAGRVFLDHARLALMQVEAASEAARRATQPVKASFVLGFLTGQEMMWLPESLRILRDDLPSIEVKVLSQTSPELTAGILRGAVDVAFIRRAERAPSLAFKHLIKEPLVVLMSRDHRLAGRASIRPRDFAGHPFIKASSKVAPALRAAVDDYAQRAGITLTNDHEVENLSMAISLIASTTSVGLVPTYVEKLMPPTVITRPLAGTPPTIDLVMAYSKESTSPLLKRFLAKADELIANVAKEGRR